MLLDSSLRAGVLLAPWISIPDLAVEQRPLAPEESLCRRPCLGRTMPQVSSDPHLTAILTQVDGGPEE